MKITSKQLRESWIKFYESKGHVNVGAVSLIGDGTTGVMFNVAGMQPLMPYLLGKPHPLGKRLCNVQGCVRTVDIESVGDASHFTFFEMMGNWSLGDYFKKEKTAWTYEILTKVYGLDGDKLCSTVFEGNESAPRDEETAGLLKSLGIKPDHIFYLPKSDNWWELEGTVGTPCGPDNEWFYPMDPENPAPVFPDDYVEIGNDVYMQYRKTETGYVPLENKNVDTGFGLDRMLLFLNGLHDGYKTDLFAGAIETLEQLTGKKYDEDEAARKAMRIVADHTRTTVMLVGDVNGILPSNTGAGYILRRLMRRAIRYCRQLGVDPAATMRAVAQVFIDEVYGEAYPLLKEKKEYILDEKRAWRNLRSASAALRARTRSWRRRIPPMCPRRSLAASRRSVSMIPTGSPSSSPRRWLRSVRSRWTRLALTRRSRNTRKRAAAICTQARRRAALRATPSRRSTFSMRH